MTLRVLAPDEAVLVSNGGRLRVLAPAGARRADDPDDGSDRCGIPGVSTRVDITVGASACSSSSPGVMMLCRGVVEGTSWETIHRDAVAWCGGGGGKGNEGEGEDDANVPAVGIGGGLGAFLSSRRFEGGGAFWVLARDADGSCFVRTDALGREPLLTRWVTGSEGAKMEKEDEDGDERAVLLSSSTWPEAPAAVWSLHHPRHVTRVDTRGGSMASCGVLPLLPKRLEPPTPPPPLRGVFAAEETARTDEDGDAKEEGTAEDNEGMDEAAREIADGLVAAVSAMATHSGATRQRPIGVLFSGGVDSTGILAICIRLGVPCVAVTSAYVASSVEPADVAPARAAAAALGARLVVREVASVAEVRAALARLTPAVVGMDVVKAGVALTTSFAVEAAAEMGCCAVMSGGGSEELLAGYARHAARPSDAAALGLSGLRSLHHRDLQRDHAAGALHGLAVLHPFLSSFVAPVANALPTRLKLLPEGIEKRALRVALERPPLSVPRRLTRRPKCAAQYGSRFHVALQKVAKSLGLGNGRLAEAVALCGTLDPTTAYAFDARSISPMPRAAAPPATWALLYTSGHNSAAAFHTAQLQRRRCAAVVPFAAGDDAWPAAVSLRSAAATFAGVVGVPMWAPGVPCYTSRSRGGVCDADGADGGLAAAFTRALVQLRRDHPCLQGVITGHVHDLGALLQVEAAAEASGLQCLAPCWGQPRASELLLTCRGGATHMLVTRGPPGVAGTVVTDAVDIRALVEEVGGAEAADGDAPRAPLDFFPARAGFYLPGQCTDADTVARVDASPTVDEGVSEVDWERVRAVVTV